MHYSVIIPTNRPVEKILPLLQSLEAQTEPASHIFIVYDKLLGPTELASMQSYLHANCSLSTIQWITNVDHPFLPHKGVSYVRNFALHLIKTPYILYIDDDNTLGHDFASSLLAVAQAHKKTYMSDCLLVPTERYQGHIRSQGYNYRNPLLGTTISTPKITQTLADKQMIAIQFASSNCLRGPTEVFRSTSFDVDMPFVYEDFDMTIRAKRKGIAIYCIANLAIEHHMTTKTKLQDMYIDTPEKAYQKAKNRILFANHYYTNKIWGLLYLFIGLPIHTIYLLGVAILGAPRGNKLAIMSAIMRGTGAGLDSFRSDTRAGHDGSI